MILWNFGRRPLRCRQVWAFVPIVTGAQPKCTVLSSRIRFRAVAIFFRLKNNPNFLVFSADLVAAIARHNFRGLEFEELAVE